MCLAIPMKITALLPTSKALVIGEEAEIEIDVSLISAPQPGDYVIVHAGFALEKLDQDEAQKTLDLFLEDEV